MSHEKLSVIDFKAKVPSMDAITFYTCFRVSVSVTFNVDCCIGKFLATAGPTTVRAVELKNIKSGGVNI